VQQQAMLLKTMNSGANVVAIRNPPCYGVVASPAPADAACSWPQARATSSMQTKVLLAAAIIWRVGCVTHLQSRHPHGGRSDAV
jgi:hypothetical protein